MSTANLKFSIVSRLKEIWYKQPLKKLEEEKWLSLAYKKTVSSSGEANIISPIHYSPFHNNYWSKLCPPGLRPNDPWTSEYLKNLTKAR